MQYKVRQLVLSALMRNEELKHCDLSVKVQGYHVCVSGAVDSPQENNEALNTIQAVSPLLKIDNQMKIRESKATLV